MQPISKDSDAVKGWGFDWATRLPAGVTLASSTWLLTDGPDAALVIVSSDFSGTDSTVKVSGGTYFKNYIVTNRITDSNGDTDDFSFSVVITSN